MNQPSNQKKNWTRLKKHSQDLLDLKRNLGIRALADYIVFTMTDDEIETLLPMLHDPTKKVSVEILVTENKQA